MRFFHAGSVFTIYRSASKYSKCLVSDLRQPDPLYIPNPERSSCQIYITVLSEENKAQHLIRTIKQMNRQPNAERHGDLVYG